MKGLLEMVQYWREVHRFGASWLCIAAFLVRWHSNRKVTRHEYIYHEEPEYMAEDLA